MGDHNVTLIDDVDALRDDLTLKVCVINLWKHMSFYNKDDIWAIELILLDEKDVSAFYITSPSVASQKPECAEFSGTKFGFSFVEYESILSFLHPQDTSVDVIGLVVAVSEMMRDNSDGSKHRLMIHIQDARFMIPIRVQDNIGTITLTMFEKEGRYLLKSSAKELVKRMTQTGITQSLDIGLGEFESQDNRTLKDAIFGTDDNITPSTVDKNSATSPMKLNNTTPVFK
uniref:Replication factor A C-terminal domain-containing protein n=1 Tax=Lactuca sativa TaxID=4236 RepID=A0A9R1VXU9_LACSA|nr:hypothetical protein LSAT_V11C400193430 [Lactuca sativa]